MILLLMICLFVTVICITIGPDILQEIHRKRKLKNNGQNKCSNLDFYSEEDKLLEITNLINKGWNKTDAFTKIEERNQLLMNELSNSKFDFNCPVCKGNNWRIFHTSIGCKCDISKELKKATNGF